MPNGERALAGCTTAAMAQILMYYKYPSVIRGHNYTWANDMCMFPDGSISISSSREVKQLYVDIAEMHIETWGGLSSGGSLSSIPSIQSCFQNLGYTVRLDTLRVKMPISDIFEFLDRGKLIFMSGIDKFREKGHAWVVDGYRGEVRNITVTARPPSSGSMYIKDYNALRMVHCNMGWSGKSNGYYRFATFNTGYPAYPDGPVTNPDDTRVYNHKLKWLFISK